MKKVIITGGDGFIGSHLSRLLAEEDMEVYALIIPNSPFKKRIQNVRRVHAVECDLNDFENIVDKLPKQPDVFFHFAWCGVAPESRKSIDIQKENINLTLNSVKLAGRLNAKKFILPGSTFEYSFSGKIINRDTPPSPQDEYGATKIASKYYCEVMCKQLGIPFVYVVISGIYSPDRIDNNVITYTIDKLLHKEKPLLTKLEQLWDYVHIDDVMNALKLIIYKGKASGFYVIGHGDNWPLRNYIFKIRDLIDPSLELGIGEVPYSSEKIPMSCVDLSELQEDTGFIPTVSFEVGIVDMIDRMRERMP